jgi:predicted dinucleotide-binding enzyme
LAEDLGFDGVDAGDLKQARVLEPLALFWVQLAFNQVIRLNTKFKLLLIRSMAPNSDF